MTRADDRPRAGEPPHRANIGARVTAMSSQCQLNGDNLTPEPLQCYSNGEKRYCVDFSSLCGIHQSCVAYTKAVWHIPKLCGIHQSCVAFVKAVWHTPKLCGICQSCVAYTKAVWHLSKLCGICFQRSYPFVCRNKD